MKDRSDGWQGTMALFAVVNVSRHPLFRVGPPVGLEGLSEGISFGRMFRSYCVVYVEHDLALQGQAWWNY